MKLHPFPKTNHIKLVLHTGNHLSIQLSNLFMDRFVTGLIMWSVPETRSPMTKVRGNHEQIVGISNVFGENLPV